MPECSTMAGATAGQLHRLLVGLLLLLTMHVAAAATATQWTVFIYLLADNDLEQYGLLDMEEVMGGMAAEPLGCVSSSCNSGCPDGTVVTYNEACTPGDASSGTRSRCCPADSYPDVLLLVDRGTGQSTTLFNNVPHADYSLLNSDWTTAKELLALPGGQWQQLKDHGELDMANPDTLSAFLQRGLTRFPPTSNRKYMLVFWDHGSGWWGYGVDHTCSALSSYATTYGCDMLSVQKLAQGLAGGLKDPVTQAPVVLDIIGFDACLMAMYEVGSALAPYTKYLVASELLEPGHGWDYAAPLAGITQRVNTAGDSVASLSTKDVADWVIKGYFDQAVEYGTSGLTMGLLDLSLVVGPLESNITGLSTYLSNQVTSNPSYAMEIMRKRASLSTISGAEDNVDLGALLNSFLTLPSSNLLHSILSSTGSVYQGVVVSYDRDAELADGTGMAIYFPSSSDNLDTHYNALVTFDSAALTAWLSFLDVLYKKTAQYTSSIGPFYFLEQYAVPYLAVTSSTWITHGTLSNYMGLTASLMYGFRTPSGTQFITAGNSDAAIVGESAVGVWSGYLFGLVQDLLTGDNAVDGLALAYADEQRITGLTGDVTQLILQVKVYYASSCNSATSEMQSGVVKYVFDVQSQATTMQLFVSSTGGSWGEVPPAQGGVIIPYLGSYNLTAGAVNRVGVSFGYSDCLKWGYADSIQLAAFDAVQAADVLGLDLTRDMETQLLVKSIDGAAVSIAGSFRAAQKTLAGCQCSQMWDYTSTTNGSVVERVYGTCINPNGDTKGAWCMYEPDSCTGIPANDTYDYCAPSITLSGCKCHPNWSLQGDTYYGSCANDGDTQGSWCVVDTTSCPGNYRAHQYGANSTTQVTINGQSINKTLTGLNFDYCQVTTLNGCHCQNPWTYGNRTYHGTCRQGLVDGATLPGFSAETSWCYIDSGCAGAGYLEGYRFDVCTAEGGRVTDTGAACSLPATYHGVVMYDCLSYNQTTGNTSQPWCFTNTTSEEWGYCAPWSCSAALKQHCPAVDPSTAASLTPWTSSSCLETLCNSQQALVNTSQCTTDLPQDIALLNNTFKFLSGSTQFGQALQSTTGTGSLSAYCDAKFGRLCVDTVVDKACPGLFRSNNMWWLSKDPSLLCDMGCLTTLCQMQEQAKSRVKGTPKWQTAVASATRGYALPSTACEDASLENLVRWMLMQEMDLNCGWSVPTNLACNRLLSPPQLCAASTMLTASKDSISDSVPANGYYSASSSCSWTINMPDQPYITLNFTSFDTEELYDVVTVEDFDGVIGMFSGKELPPSLGTDTGMLKLQFTSDGSIEGHGFAASYIASSTPQFTLPTCSGRSKMVQAVLRTRQYGSELSWLVTARSTVFGYLNAPNQFNIVMAGGLLPSSLKSKVPATVAAVADAEYKDYRSYYSYACLQIGNYNLNLYDSYGDGWDGGRLTITQMVNASAGCELLAESTTTSNKTVAFSITEDADTSSAACSSLVTQSLVNPYYVDAGLVITNEDTNTFNLAKQRKIKEALALLMDVDAGQVSIQSIATATRDDISIAQWVAPTKSGITAFISGRSASNDSNISMKQTRRLVFEMPDEASGAEGTEAAAAPPDSIQHMLQQQQQQQEVTVAPSSASSRRQKLAKLAVPVSQLVASGVFSTDRQLLAAQLQQYQGAAAAAQTVEQQHACAQQYDLCSASGGGSSSCAKATSPGCPASTGAAGSSAAAIATSRKLQQLLVLDQQGDWQPSNTAAPEEVPGISDMAAALAAQPLGRPNPGTNSSSPFSGRLASLLRPRKPITGPKPPSTSRGASKPSRVSLDISFRDAFAHTKPSSGSTSTIEPVYGISSVAGDGQVAAGVPKPSTVDGADTQLTTVAGAEATEPASSAAAPAAVPLFDAIRPARSLIELQEFSARDAQDASAEHRARRRQQRQHQSQQQQAGAAQVTVNEGPSLRMDSGAATEFVDFIEGGRYRPNHARPRPRPVRPGRQSLEVTSGNDSNDSTSNVSRTAAAAGNSTGNKQSKQPQMRLMGPKMPIRRKHKHLSSSTAAHIVPGKLWAGGPSAATGMDSSGSGSRSSRQLLANSSTSNTTKGLLVAVRVSGYKTEAAAAAAGGDLQQLVTNGTLHSTLAAQGWAGVEVGIKYTATGMRLGPWENTSLRNIIIGAATAGGVVFAAVAVGIWWVQRTRMRAAAQVPAATGYANPRQSLGPGSYSGVVGSHPSSSPTTMHPSMAAAGGAGGYHSGGSYTAGQAGYSPVSAAYPSAPYPPQAYTGPQVQGRSRSASMPTAGLVMTDVFASRGHSMVAAHANPFAAGGVGGFSPAGSPMGQYGSVPISPRTQPWVDVDGMTRGSSYTHQQQQQQQHPGVYQQQQQHPQYGEVGHAPVEMFSPPLRPAAASITSPNINQAGVRTASPW